MSMRKVSYGSGLKENRQELIQRSLVNIFELKGKSSGDEMARKRVKRRIKKA